MPLELCLAEFTWERTILSFRINILEDYRPEAYLYSSIRLTSKYTMPEYML